MRVFVAGATGVIGRRVVRLLTDRGDEVTAHGSDLDLFDPAAVRQGVAGHDLVINLATSIPTGSKMAMRSSWQLTNRIRTEGATNLAEAALGEGVPLIQESVVTVYEDGGTGWIDESAELIDDPIARAVLVGERRALRTGGAALRFGFFYGPDAAHTQDEVAFARRGFASIPGEPDAYYPDLHLDDAAAAVVSALDAPSGVYNVAGEPLPRGERADVLAACVGREELRLPPSLLGKVGLARLIARSRRVSSRALQEATGWTPRFPSVREGLPPVVREIETR